MPKFSMKILFEITLFRRAESSLSYMSKKEGPKAFAQLALTKIHAAYYCDCLACNTFYRERDKLVDVSGRKR